jgi:hypothetical protein
LVATYGDAVAPFAGLAPLDEAATSTWRQQVQVHALSHLGTLRELQTWDLPCLIVKGLPWAKAYWGDPLRRPAHDIDLVVPDESVVAWTDRMQAAGFDQGPSSLVWRRGRQFVQIHHPSSRHHWLHHVQPPWSEFWQRSVWQDLDGMPIRQPDPADSLLYLAHHQVFRHGGGHDVGWLDLAGWVATSAYDWTNLAIERAAGSHLQASLQVLHWAWQHIWHLPPFLDLPEPGPFVRLWASQALKQGDGLTRTMLSLALATADERLVLIKAGPAAGKRLWHWQHLSRHRRQEG